MKNFISAKSLVSVFIALLTFLILNVCCKSSDEEVLEKPSIRFNEDGNEIIVSIYLRNDTEYLNIFRVKLENGRLPKIRDKENVSNIAQIVPYDKALNAISYLDKYIEKGTKYSYCIRYYNGSIYDYSDWTDWPVNENAETESQDSIDEENFDDSSEPDGQLLPPKGVVFEEKDLKYNTENCYFRYDEKNYKLLVMAGTVENDEEETEEPETVDLNNNDSKVVIENVDTFDESFDTCLVVTDDKMHTKTFRVIPANKNDSGENIGFIAGDFIDLRSTITPDFFDKDITIDGLIYRKFTKNVDGKQYDEFIWSEKAKIVVTKQNTDGTDEVTEKIKILVNSDTENDHDFSDFFERTHRSADCSVYVENQSELKEDYSKFN